MNPEGEGWRAFRKAAIKANEVIAAGMVTVPGALVEDAEQSHLVQMYRLLFMLAAGARGLLDIPDWRKSPRPFQQNLLRWARENPPYMRRVFSFCDLFEPMHQPHFWRFRPSDGSLKEAIEIFLETDPSLWEPSWPGDIYPLLVDEGKRKELGAHYTPWPVVDFIVDRALGPLCYAQPEKRKQPRDEKEILSIRALDPAVGGGRFVIGAVDYIANAIAAARNEPPRAEHHRAAAERIYGVDRSPLIVDIARAGLWLYLGGPDKPWDYLRNHFRVGDTLIGATLGEMDKDTPETSENPDQLALFKAEGAKRETLPLKVIAESGRLAPRIEALADLWTAALLDKEAAREEYPLVRVSMPHVSEERWSELEGKPGFQEARRLARELKFFHWELRFPDVFLHGENERRGFDAVIGNPPYRRERGSGAALPFRWAPPARQWGEAKMDILALFIHRGLDLLNPSGRLAFITSSYWLKAEGASKLRRRLANDERFQQYVDLSNHPVFEGLSGRHGILVVGRGARHPHPCKVLRLKSEWIGNPDTLPLLSSNPRECFTEEEFQDQRELLDEAGLFNLSDRAADLICRKMEENGVPLGEVAQSSQGVVENPPEITARMIAALAETNPSLVSEEGYEPGEAVFLLPPDHHLITTLSEQERAFLRPYYRPVSIRRYHIPEEPDGYLIYLTPENCPDISVYPWLREHLERYRVFTEERREVKEGKIAWWHLHWPREESLFNGEHLVLPQMSESPRVARAPGPAYVGMSADVVVAGKGLGAAFLEAVLNSRAVEFYLSDGGRAKERGARLDITLSALRRIPIPRIPPQEKSNPKKVGELMNMYNRWIAVL